VLTRAPRQATHGTDGSASLYAAAGTAVQDKIAIVKTASVRHCGWRQREVRHVPFPAPLKCTNFTRRSAPSLLRAYFHSHAGQGAPPGRDQEAIGVDPGDLLESMGVAMIIYGWIMNKGNLVLEQIVTCPFSLIL